MKKGDFVIIAAVVLLIVGSVALTLVGAKNTPSTVTVTVKGEKTQEFSLNEDVEVKLETENGYNVLKISDGTADIISADCYSNDCVHQRKISKNGEMIVCLPHKLVVTITSDAEGENDF